MSRPHAPLEQVAGTQERALSTREWLTTGGDARIALDASRGLNTYGCRPFPDAKMLAYGSSTASIISLAGYRCANRLRKRLQEAVSVAAPGAVYNRELGRIRAELLQLCELPDTTHMIFSPSGTDVHAIAAHYAESGASLPPLIVMAEANETGKGVVAAMAGTGLAKNPDVVQVPIRQGDGTPRPPTDIDADVETLVSAAVASNRRVLLILIDQTKTGLIAPSPGFALMLHQRFQNHIDVLVDACQFRVAPPTLRAYLEQGFMIALTGSKFLTGPSFSAVLLIPQKTAQRLQLRPFPVALTASGRANWPSNWPMTANIAPITNFGLLLRWEAALQELRTFNRVPQATVTSFLQAFASAIQQRLNKDPLLEPLPVPQLDRRPLTTANSWDHLQTIFPFLLYHADAGRTPLSAEETLQVYQQLPVNLNETSTFNAEHPDAAIAALRCQLGQPVACGRRNGVAISALRLCMSTRLLVKAAADGDKGVAVIATALAALDKTALLIRSLPACDASQ